MNALLSMLTPTLGAQSLSQGPALLKTTLPTQLPAESQGQANSPFDRLLEESEYAKRAPVSMPAVVPFEDLLFEVAHGLVEEQPSLLEVSDDVRDVGAPTVEIPPLDAMDVGIDPLVPDAAELAQWPSAPDLEPPATESMVAPSDQPPEVQDAANGPALIEPQEFEQTQEPEPVMDRFGGIPVEPTQSTSSETIALADAVDLAPSEVVTPELPVRPPTSDVVEVRVDDKLTVQVRAADGEVDVTLLGSDAVQPVLETVEPELREELQRGGYDLREFERRDDEDRPRSQNTPNEEDDEPRPEPRRIFEL